MPAKSNSIASFQSTVFGNNFFVGFHVRPIV
jgi:hypothetical protein